jgi:phosphatidylserine/phosphatidylglycerophosphate/cardiolipin synthase-like enzyme
MPNPGATFSTNHLKFFFLSQRANLNPDLADQLVAFLGATNTSLDCAIYDLREPAVLTALRDLDAAGKKLRIAYHGGEKPTEQALQQFNLLRPGLSYAVHSTGNHLMHNKFLVRDGDAVWTGSANFTKGGLQLQDNNCVTISSAAMAKQYAADFESLVSPQTFVNSTLPSKSVSVGGVQLTPSFEPGSQEGIEDAIVSALAGAQKVRILAFLMSDTGILDALVRFNTPGSDIKGVYDYYGMMDSLGKKTPDPVRFWFLKDSRFLKAPSHKYNPAPGAEQDFMHNKVMILDDHLVVTGSYNFSENAEANDENSLLIDSPQVAAAYTTYFDTLYAKYV